MKMRAILFSLSLALSAVQCTKPKRDPGAASPSTSASTAPPAPFVEYSPGGAELPEDIHPQVLEQVMVLANQAAALDKLVFWVEQAEPAMLALLAGSQNIEELVRALQFFERTKRASGVEPGAKLVRHVSARVRRQVVITLTALAARDQLAALETAAKDRDSTVRSLAAEALSTLGKSGGSAALLAQLDDRDEQVATDAAAALAKTGDKSLIPKLEARLASPRASTVVAAFMALRRLKATIPLPAIQRAIGHPDERVVAAGYRALPFAEGEARVELVAKALEDPRPDVRRVGLEESALLAPEAQLAAATKALEDANVDVRAAALDVLAAKLDKTQAMRTLIRLLRDPQVLMRRAAAVWLERMGKEAEQPLMARLSSEDDRETLKLLINALGTIKSEAAIEALVQVLEGPGSGPRMNAAMALEAITGQKLGMLASKWRAWLATRGQ